MLQITVVIIFFLGRTYYVCTDFVLNKLDITSKFHVTMFITVVLQTILHTESVSMFMSYLHTKLHIPSLNSDQIKR
jgi:hypothetical protein